MVLSLATGCVAEQDAASTFEQRRQQMVRHQLLGRDIDDPRVLAAMGKVPRHLFVPAALRDFAYEDRAWPIGHDQTISQPYVVAMMSQHAKVPPTARVLEIGTGSGYQAAVLAELAQEVYSIEIVQPLAEQARQRLADLGYANVTVRHGDGYRGWPEHGPFDVILVTAAPDHLPQPLIDQLKPGGRLVVPVGGRPRDQELLVIVKKADGRIERRTVAPVSFVPMTGEAEKAKVRQR